VTIFFFIIGITVVVGFHELGHFAAARAFGIRVLVFSIGFGRPIYRYTSANGTEWRISLIPLGGYVKMLDVHDDVAVGDSLHGTDQPYDSQPAWRKIVVSIAGPVANLILSVVFFLFVFLFVKNMMPPQQGVVVPDSPVQLASLMEGDLITEINGRRIDNWSDIYWELIRHSDAEIDVLINRGGEALSLRVVTEDNKKSGLVAGFQPPLIKPVIGYVDPEGSGFASGLRRGDLIERIGATYIKSWTDLVVFVSKNPGSTIPVTVLREGQQVKLQLVIGFKPESSDVGYLGVRADNNATMISSSHESRSITLAEAFFKAVVRTWDLSLYTLSSLASMIQGHSGLENLSGPVGIAKHAGISAERGLMSYVLFLSLLSVSLAVINMLPLPLLDGGHVLLHVYELIMGKKVPEKVIVTFSRLGLVAILSLTVFLLANDISKLQ